MPAAYPTAMMIQVVIARWCLSLPAERKGAALRGDLELGRVEQVRLLGRVALVTGGASGIGAAVAERLQAGGAKVMTFDADALGRHSGRREPLAGSRRRSGAHRESSTAAWTSS